MTAPSGQDDTLKARLARKQLTIGSWLACPYTPVCEIMVKAGFEWLVVDMEHTSISVSEQCQLIQTIELGGSVPLVRVGANDPLLIKRALDAGAHGIIVPMVNTVEEAQRAVDSVYYPPRGQRGVGLSRAQDWGIDFEAYRAWADRETVLLIQVEHVDGVANLEAMLEVDGVDGFIIGPYDLSGSLGHPGDWNHPSVVESLGRVEEIMRSASKPGGFHVVHSNHDELQERIRRGYRFIAYGNDMVFLADTVTREAAAARAMQDSAGT